MDPHRRTLMARRDAALTARDLATFQQLTTEIAALPLRGVTPLTERDLARWRRAHHPPTCPTCGASITTTLATVTEPMIPTYHVRGRRLPTRDRLITIAACNGCEFILELR